jgi:hypothetical protein
VYRFGDCVAARRFELFVGGQLLSDFMAAIDLIGLLENAADGLPNFLRA